MVDLDRRKGVDVRRWWGYKTVGENRWSAGTGSGETGSPQVRSVAWKEK